VKESQSAVVTPAPFLLSRNMFPCLHPVITVSMAKLQINERNAKEKACFFFLHFRVEVTSAQPELQKREQNTI
jgi:hypothetical protein